LRTQMNFFRQFSKSSLTVKSDIAGNVFWVTERPEEISRCQLGVYSRAPNSRQISNCQPQKIGHSKELAVTQNRNVNRIWQKYKLPLILYEELKYS
jgi:hypothetical protein